MLIQVNMWEHRPLTFEFHPFVSCIVNVDRLERDIRNHPVWTANLNRLDHHTEPKTQSAIDWFKMNMVGPNAVRQNLLFRRYTNKDAQYRLFYRLQNDPKPDLTGAPPAHVVQLFMGLINSGFIRYDANELVDVDYEMWVL